MWMKYSLLFNFVKWKYSEHSWSNQIRCTAFSVGFTHTHTIMQTFTHLLLKLRKFKLIVSGILTFPFLSCLDQFLSFQPPKKVSMNIIIDTRKLNTGTLGHVGTTKSIWAKSERKKMHTCFHRGLYLFENSSNTPLNVMWNIKSWGQEQGCRIVEGG